MGWNPPISMPFFFGVSEKSTTRFARDLPSRGLSVSPVPSWVQDLLLAAMATFGKIYEPNLDLYMGVNPKIGGKHPKSSILTGFGTIIFTIHFGVPLFWETPIWRFFFHRFFWKHSSFKVLRSFWQGQSRFSTHHQVHRLARVGAGVDETLQATSWAWKVTAVLKTHG